MGRAIRRVDADARPSAPPAPEGGPRPTADGGHPRGRDVGSPSPPGRPQPSSDVAGPETPKSLMTQVTSRFSAPAVLRVVAGAQLSDLHRGFGTERAIGSSSS